MNKVQLNITVGVLGLFLLINHLAGGGYGCAHCPGGLPWYGWGSGLVVLLITALIFARWRGARSTPQTLAQPVASWPDGQEPDEKWNEDLRRKYDWDGPVYPHPVIVTERCIGCHACIESCPHDVLTISYTEKHQPVASVVDPELCMEDTSCEAICPVSPKACIVVNTQNKIRSLPAPWRNSMYMSRVKGCYIIGDVSGTPLIKNAANEGAAVMVHIAHELHTADAADPQPPVDYDVAIIGAGPAGLSATVMAKKLNMRYLAVEQDTVMSTIRKYSEGKYVFLKPETMLWAGAIPLPSFDEYMEEVLEEMLDEPDRAHVVEMLAKERSVARRLEEKAEAAKRDGKKYERREEDELDPQIVKTLAAARERYQQLLEAELKGTLAAEAQQRLRNARARLEKLLDGEEKYVLGQLLAEECAGQIKEEEVGKKHRLALARRLHGDQLEAVIEAGKLTQERFDALADARCKVVGDQREVLLNTWLLNVKEKDIQINEKESCGTVQRAEDGDYFIIQTEKEKEKGERLTTTYHVRRVVLAIGSSSSPMKLKLGDKKIKDKRNRQEFDKILYRLSDPKAYGNFDLIVIGGGNSAVEAAVDLVAERDGDKITFPEIKRQKSVRLLVRGSGLKTDVKFRNKQQLYECIDLGLIELRFNTELIEIRDKEVVMTNRATGKDATKPNDFIFALIGSERPAALLKQIDIKEGARVAKAEIVQQL